MYSNLDKLVGHYRRYNINYFKRKFKLLTRVNIKFLDSMGMMLYYLNKLIYKNENYPSKLKIFLWDKLFTPISMIIDFITFYKFGKCILVVFKKN